MSTARRPTSVRLCGGAPPYPAMIASTVPGSAAYDGSRGIASRSIDVGSPFCVIRRASGAPEKYCAIFTSENAVTTASRTDCGGAGRREPRERAVIRETVAREDRCRGVAVREDRRDQAAALDGSGGAIPDERLVDAAAAVRFDGLGAGEVRAAAIG